VSNARPGTAGATRACPHCKATVLETAAVCPSCRHHLRFDDSAAVNKRQAERLVPLKVEGTVRHPHDADAYEYTAVVVIRDQRGQELDRHVVGVGALRAGEQRTFSLAVEMFPHTGATAPRGKRRLS
jgi:glutaredoxin